MTEGGDNNEIILRVAEDSLKRLAEDTTPPAIWATPLSVAGE